MSKIVYVIDPQSVNSLAAYDRCMLDGITDLSIHFFGNSGYNDGPLHANVKFTPVFRYGKFNNSVLKGISYLWSLLVIICYAIFERPAIAHFQWIRVWVLDWMLIQLLKKCIDTKIVFTVHNILPRKRGKNTYSRFKRLYNFADILIAHTETSKLDLETQFMLPANKIVIMPHGLIEMRVAEEKLIESEKRINEKYNLRGKTIFGALGVQSPYKGTDILIEAWTGNSVLSQRDDIILLIAGKPSDLIIPEILPKNIIVMAELLSNSDFKYLLQRTDVMLLPYRAIEQSGVLLSLIHEMKPYCCTNVGELTKPFETADVGWIIPEVTDMAISEVLEKIVNDKSIIEEKKNNVQGWRALQHIYSWNNSNRILRSIYINLLEL